MAHTNKVVVYSVADEGITATDAHIKIFSALEAWEDLAEVFGKIKRKEIAVVDTANAELYQPLRADGLYRKPRAKNAKKSPAPYVVSQHDLIIESSREQTGAVLNFFIGPNSSAAFDADDFMDIDESAMMDINEKVASVKSLATDSDGIDGLVYDIMQHAAFWPDNEFEASTYQEYGDEQVVLVAYHS